MNIAIKIVLAPTLGAVGLALATSAGITLYAMLLYRAGRARGFLSAPRPRAVGGIVATGLALGLMVIWSRAAALRSIESVAANWALPVAFLLFVLGTVAFQGLATVLMLGRGALSGTDTTDDEIGTGTR